MIKSNIFKELTSPEIERVVGNLYGSGAKIVECQLMKGGVFNTTYFVKIDAAEGGIVLRVAPINQHLLFAFEQSMMSAEPLIYRLLGENDVPTSEVVYHDSSLGVIEREYIIFNYIPSVPMNDPAVPKAVLPTLYQQLGEVVASLHQITSEQFGWLRPQGQLPMFDSWSGFLRRFAGEVAEKTAAHGLFSDGELGRFLAVFEETAVFDQIATPQLTHSDLWEGNVLVHEKDGRWQIAALIDVDKAVFGDKSREFSFPTLLNDDFLRGYRGVVEQSAEGVFRQNGYRLLENFMYAYVWSVQLENKARFEAVKRDGLSTLALF